MISDYDFDQLSAYLDDQLVPAEKAALEARLAAEPELRTTLRELRLTVRALRALPPVALPRSFVLTPAQVGVSAKAALPARRPLAPALRLAAAFSAVALAFVVFTDLRGGVVLTAAPVADTANSTVLATTVAAEAPLDAVAAAPSETPVADEGTTILEFAVEEATPTPAAESDGAGAGEAGTGPAATPESSAALLPEATATDSAERNSTTPEPEDTTGTKGADVAATPTEPGPAETPIGVAAVPPPEATAEARDAYEQTNSGGGAQQAPAPSLPPVRVLELALALLTVLLGLWAWLARRSG